MGELTRIVHEMNALDELKQINTTGQRRDPLRPGGAPLASSLESDARKLDLQPAKVAAALCSSLDLAPSAVVVDVGAGTGDHVSQPASTWQVSRPSTKGIGSTYQESARTNRTPLRARAGLFALEFASLLPSGRVFALEVRADALRALHARRRAAANV